MPRVFILQENLQIMESVLTLDRKQKGLCGRQFSQEAGSAVEFRT